MTGTSTPVPDGVTGACAAVDVGTNTVRLLVLDTDGRSCFRDATITRLGTGIDRRARFDDAALAATLDAIEGYGEVWRRLGVPEEHVRIAATSAVRDAGDRKRFFDGVIDRTGVPAKVLSGSEEAAFAFRGATSGAGAPARGTDVIVVDIGGGSTEFVRGVVGNPPRRAVSLQLGSVRLTERHLADDPPTGEQVRAATDEIGARLLEADPVIEEFADDGVLIAVAGTATTIAAIDGALTDWVDGCVDGWQLEAAALEQITERLLAASSAERVAFGPVPPRRADVLHAGALILHQAVTRLSRRVVHVSESDILDGLAMDALDRARAG